MTSSQVVETSVTNNSPSQDSNHPDDLFQPMCNTAMLLIFYKPPINFCGLSLDKTDHVIQNWTVVIRGYQRLLWYPASIWFFVYRRKTKTWANLWAELLIIISWSWKTRETVLQKPGMEKLKSGWAMWYQRTWKIHKICRNDLSVLTLRINRRVIK